MLNLGKTYRTQDGKRVRALREIMKPEEKVIKGEIRKTGRWERVIEGQLYNSSINEWCPHFWEETGEDYYGDDNLDLVEEKEVKVDQPQLF